MEKITVSTIIPAPVTKVWDHWNNPNSIKGWAFASDTWECPYAENDLRVGGRFLTRMAAKDGSASFDFTGTYTEVTTYNHISYNMDKAENEHQHRECTISFIDHGNNTTTVEEEFDSEEINSIEMQRAGWTAILENFKKFVVSN